jgi:hypothetical protein
MHYLLEKQELARAMERWKERHCLYPRAAIYRILEIESRQLALNNLCKRILLSEWIDNAVTDDEVSEFIEGVDYWCQLVLVETLSHDSTRINTE